MEPLRKNVDQVWAPTSYVRDCYVDSGVDPAKVALVPQGVDPSRFRPGVSPLSLPTEKSFKFLFVGGTLYRKGIDLLLEAYCQTFSREDDVCLVIKDLGMNTFYRGMNSSHRIRELQADPTCPEIVYLTEEMRAGICPGSTPQPTHWCIPTEVRDLACQSPKRWPVACPSSLRGGRLR